MCLQASKADAVPFRSTEAGVNAVHRRTLPTVGPRPPAISTEYVSMASLHTAAQSTPSGTLIVLTVTSLAARAVARGRVLQQQQRWLAQT